MHAWPLQKRHKGLSQVRFAEFAQGFFSSGFWILQEMRFEHSPIRTDACLHETFQPAQAAAVCRAWRRQTVAECQRPQHVLLRDPAVTGFGSGKIPAAIIQARAPPEIQSELFDLCARSASELQVAKRLALPDLLRSKLMRCALPSGSLRGGALWVCSPLYTLTLMLFWEAPSIGSHMDEVLPPCRSPREDALDFARSRMPICVILVPVP